MRHTLAALALVATALAAVPAPAQQAPAGAPLSLADALALARARSPVLAMAGGRRQAAAGRARQEGAFANPVAEWRQENLGAPVDRDVFASVTLPLDLTGRRFALRGAGRDLVAASVADSTTVHRLVEAEVARAYWRAALARGLAEVAGAQRRAIGEIADFEARRLREGAVAENVALRTRLEAERGRVAEASALAALERAHAELARAIGVPAESLAAPVPLATSCDPAPPPSLDSATAAALAARPEVAAARHRVSEARHRVSAAARGTLPDVGVHAGYKRTQGYDTRVVGLLVTLPILDRNAGERERARGELAVAEAELRDAESRVRADVASAVRAYGRLLGAN
ncbi:MAG TPA: TolC family protein, partial [Gemmatimonadaceae bacterium]|nr:TolC family protein [Gemmatimonadaceae bacterium]